MKKYAGGGDVYTAEMGQPPMDPEGVAAEKKAIKKLLEQPKKVTPPNDSVFRQGMPVPQDIDGASAPRKKKMSSGGYTKSADGIAQRGKTRGTMVMCGGGMTKRK
jgi:hypothetical protein